MRQAKYLLPVHISVSGPQKQNNTSEIVNCFGRKCYNKIFYEHEENKLSGIDNSSISGYKNT